MAEGSVRQVIGTVVDVEFPTGELPEVYNAINIDLNGETLIAEVQQHNGTDLYGKEPRRMTEIKFDFLSILICLTIHHLW